MDPLIVSTNRERLAIFQTSVALSYLQSQVRSAAKPSRSANGQ